MSRAVLLISLLLTTFVQADERLPAFVLQLPVSVPDVFIADTRNASLLHYRNASGAPQLADTSYMSIGQKGVGKQRAWDGKSPLGIYFVVDRLDTSRLHEKYGVMAFPLDYPNVRDRQLEKTGDGIWVHGVKRGSETRPKLDTDGCLALPNERLVALQSSFLPLVTPVIIARSMRWQSQAERDAIRDELRAAVSAWADAFATGDGPGFFALYADDFSYRGMRFEDWRHFRGYTFSTRGPIKVRIDDLLLLADPEEQGLYLSRFRQLVITDDGVRQPSTKRLYWRHSPDGQLRVVAEDNG